MAGALGAALHALDALQAALGRGGRGVVKGTRMANPARAVEAQLRSTTRLRSSCVALHDARPHGARATAPVAWCTSVGPAELLRALGFKVYFPENHGAMLGASRMANETMPLGPRRRATRPTSAPTSRATSARTSRGRRPLQRLRLARTPRADVLVFNTNQCRDVQDWFEFYGREWNVPVVGVTLVRDLGEVERAPRRRDRPAARGARPAARGGGRPPPRRDRLWRRWCSARATCTISGSECCGPPRHRPAPLTFFDGTIQMGPAVVLRGTARGLRLLPAAAAPSCEERVARRARARSRASAFRLYWEGMPVWGRLRELRDAVRRRSRRPWSPRPTATAGSSRRSTRAIPSARWRAPRSSSSSRGPRSRRSGTSSAWSATYAVDGVVFHDAKTCPNNSNTRYRDAAAAPARARHAVLVPQRRPERPALLLRRAGADQHRGLRRAARGLRAHRARRRCRA